MPDAPPPTVVHYVFSFLPVTCSWIYPQVTGVDGVNSRVLCHQTENEEMFALGHPVTVSPRPVTRYRNVDLIGRLRYRQEMRRAIHGLNPDLIHAHFGREGACVVDLAQRLERPLICSFYGFDLALTRYAWWRRRYVRLFKDGARFLCEGPHALRKLVEMGCPEDKCRVLRLGIDLNALPFRERKTRDDAPLRILMAASLREKKGTVYGVEAFARCARTHLDARLVIIGDGPLRTKVEEQIDKECMRDKVTTLGYTSREEYLQQLYEADLLLAPSVTAGDGDTEGGSPVTITEAAASGIPVVTTSHADIPEAVVDGKTGLLVPERDVNGLADAMQRLMSSSSLRQEMGWAARRHVEEHFDRREQLRQLGQHYREISRSAS